MGGRAGGGARGGGGAGRGFGDIESRISGTVQLSGIGEISAAKAGDLRLGDNIVKNYGYTEHVVGLERKGTSSIAVTIKDGGGKTFTFTTRKSTKFGVVTSKNVKQTLYGSKSNNPRA